jgi:hypothetical protein
MESLLRQRKAQLWEKICKEHKVRPKLAQEVLREIQNGTFQNYLNKKYEKEIIK